MNSLRMCVVCRQKKEKTELIRVVKLFEGEPEIDLTYKAQGRGAYVCKDEKCISLAEKKKTFEKSLKCSLSSELYKSLGDMING